MKLILVSLLLVLSCGQPGSQTQSQSQTPDGPTVVVNRGYPNRHPGPSRGHSRPRGGGHGSPGHGGGGHGGHHLMGAVDDSVCAACDGQAYYDCVEGFRK